MTAFTIIGINDDKSFCQCCGKIGLKRVVWIRNEDTQEVKHFGTTCALSPKKGFYLEEQLKVAIKKYTDHIENMNRACHAKYRSMGGKYTSSGGKLTPTNPELMEETRNEYRRTFATAAPTTTPA